MFLTSKNHSKDLVNIPLQCCIEYVILYVDVLSERFDFFPFHVCVTQQIDESQLPRWLQCKHSLYCTRNHQCTISSTCNNYRAPRSKKRNFRTKFFGKFQDIFVGFTRLKTQKMHVFLCSKTLISQANQYCSHKNVTKAMLHIKQWTVTIVNRTGHSTSAIKSPVMS